MNSNGTCSRCGLPWSGSSTVCAGCLVNVGMAAPCPSCAALKDERNAALSKHDALFWFTLAQAEAMLKALEIPWTGGDMYAWLEGGINVVRKEHEELKEAKRRIAELEPLGWNERKKIQEQAKEDEKP